MTAEQIGPYRIVQRLGAGGMGEVFLADDTRLGRKVALKTLSASGDNQPAETRRKLLREARAAARLNHPNIVAIYDVVEFDDEAHIVMEYVPGETLAKRLAAGSLAAATVVDLGVQIADALVDAHGAGVVHRDLKPANIAMGPGGKPKIAVARDGQYDPCQNERTRRIAIVFARSSGILGRDGECKGNVYPATKTVCEGDTVHWSVIIDPELVIRRPN